MEAINLFHFFNKLEHFITLSKILKNDIIIYCLIIMNYLDILDTDLLNNIFNMVANSIEKDIEKIKNKLYKVKNLVEGLIIDVDSEEEYEDSYIYYINYYNISYCMDKYLYSQYPLNNIIIVYRLKLVVCYITGNPIILQSNLLKKPLYLDLLREIHKLYMMQTEILGYYDDRKYLENIRPIKEDEYTIYNINPYCIGKLNYITIELVH